MSLSWTQLKTPQKHVFYSKNTGLCCVTLYIYIYIYIYIYTCLVYRHPCICACVCRHILYNKTVTTRTPKQRTRISLKMSKELQPPHPPVGPENKRSFWGNTAEVGRSLQEAAICCCQVRRLRHPRFRALGCRFLCARTRRRQVRL